MTFPRRSAAQEVWSIAAVALLLRLALILAYPPVFGGDSVLRLANGDRILLSYQLPALQTLVYLCAQVDGLLLTRVVIALIAAVASAGVYRMARRILPRRGAYAAGLLFAVNPFIATYSIVPYQEILMLGALAWAFAWRWDGRPGLASAALALACWTRYEAWLAVPVFLLAELRARGLRSSGFWKRVALYSWAPLLWIAVRGGLTPEGSFALDSGGTLERFHRWLYLAWITVKNTPVPALAAAAWGAVCLFRLPARSRPRWAELALLTALFLVAILFSAHGERDDPDRWVTAREAHLLLTGAALLGGLGLSRLRRGRRLLLTAGVLAGIAMSRTAVVRETAEPRVLLSYEAALWLDEYVGAEETVLLVGRPIPQDQLERYFRIVGDRAQAEANLRRIYATPPDHQRILVQSSLGRERLFDLSTLPAGLEPDWVVRWMDAPLPEPRFLGGSLETRVRAGDVHIEIRLRATPPR